MFGSIFVDTEAAEKSIHKIGEAAESFGSRLVQVGDKVSDVGRKLALGLTTPIAAIGTKAVKTAADFEAAMSEVSAISGATGEDFRKLEDLAKEMGKTTKFSASESAEALKYMAMAGWKTEEMLGGLEGIMNLAAASGEDLGTTSDIVTDALTAFGLSASDSGRFADLLAKASSNANTNVRMMGETFKYVAPVAGSLGYSAEDVALAVGLMANSGIKASQAGTSLRSSLTNLANPTEDMVGLMVSLGLATQDTANVIDDGKLQKAQAKVENRTIDMEKAQVKYNEAVNRYGASSSQAQTALLNLEKAENNLREAVRDLNAVREGEIEITGVQNNLLVDGEGNMRTLREVMLMLRTAFQDLSEEEQAQAAATLFGKEAMSGMLAVINSSEADFSKLVAAIDSADGAAAEMARTMNDNLNGQITMLKSQVEALLIQFGELVMPHVKAGVEWLSRLVEYISNLDEGTKDMIVRIGLMAAAVGPLLAVLGNGVSVVGNVIVVGSRLMGGIGNVAKLGGGLVAVVTKVIGVLGGAATFLTGTLIPAITAIGAPVLIVIGVITALIAAGVLLYKNWDEITEWAGNCWEKITDFVSGAVEKIIGFFGGIVDFVKDNWQGLLMLLVNPFAGGFKLLYDNCEQFRNFIDGFFGKVKEGFLNFASGVAENFSAFKDTVAEKAGELKDRVVDRFRKLKEEAVDRFGELKEKASDRFRELSEKVLSKARELKDKAADEFNGLREKAGEKLSALKAGALEVFNGIRDRGLEGFEKLKAGALERFDHLKAGITEKLDAVKDFMAGVVQKLKDFFKFDWKLPKIKLPHFKITGSFSLSPPSIPKIGVDWYKGGGIMTKPTAFGINPASGRLMAGGEAGPEAIAPIGLLKGYVREAVEEGDGRLYEALAAVLELLREWLPKCQGGPVVLDTGALVGGLAGPMNEEMGWSAHARRRRK